MGSCVSSSANLDETKGPVNSTVRSNSIEKALKADEQANKRVYKLLLLGAGESGKSTILKQMRNLHNLPFTPSELSSLRDLLFENILTTFALIVDSMEEWGIDVESQNTPALTTLLSVLSTHLSPSHPSQPNLVPFPAELKQVVLDLWADQGVRKTWKRGRERCFPENMVYLMEGGNVERFWGKEYEPSMQDVLRIRAKTVGVEETVFQIGGNTFNFIDVGGQRSERRKWIHCFDRVAGVIFVVSLAGYDTSLVEDETANQTQEALLLYSQISNSLHFRSSHHLLFLNKLDLFQTKILLLESPIKTFFPDYNAPEGDVEAGVRFFRKKFLRLFRGRSGAGGSGWGESGNGAELGGARKIYVHETTAVDPKLMKFVMLSTTDIIIRSRLENIGLL